MERPHTKTRILRLAVIFLIAWTLGSGDGTVGQKEIEEIYFRYKRLMFATAGKFTANMANQEDIVQDALVRLIKILTAGGTPPHRVSAGYIVCIVRSVSIDFLRRQQRESERHADIEDEHLAALTKTDGNPEDLLLPSDSAQRLRGLWPQLPPEDRLLLEGKYILELTDRDLADMLKCKPDSIRMKLTRARRRAIRLLSERDQDE